ncbi:MAG: hypothetical protein V4733_04000 [Verrucomicrobiota bacterium]
MIGRFHARTFAAIEVVEILDGLSRRRVRSSARDHKSWFAVGEVRNFGKLRPLLPILVADSHDQRILPDLAIGRRHFEAPHATEVVEVEIRPSGDFLPATAVWIATKQGSGMIVNGGGKKENLGLPICCSHFRDAGQDPRIVNRSRRWIRQLGIIDEMNGRRDGACDRRQPGHGRRLDHPYFTDYRVFFHEIPQYGQSPWR